VHALHRAERADLWPVGNSPLRNCRFQSALRLFSRTTLISMIGALRRLCHRWLTLWIDPVPRLSARFPIFFNVVSRARQLFRARIAKTFLISAACCENRRDQFFAFGVSDTIRTRRSSGLSTRLPGPFRRGGQTATLTSRGKVHLRPIAIHTGKGPLFRRASSIRKSYRRFPSLPVPHKDISRPARKAFPNTSQQ